MALNSKKNDRTTDVNNIVFDGISTVVERHSVKESSWIGTMTELTTALNKVVSKTQRKMLPGSPSALRLVINRVINRLRNRGIGVKFGRTTDHTRTRFVKFAR
jgi:molybdopterin biosynthesis enzyme MoaB